MRHAAFFQTRMRALPRIAVVLCLSWPAIVLLAAQSDEVSRAPKAALTHAKDCVAVRVLGRQKPTPTLLRYSQQETEIDAGSMEEHVHPPIEYEFVSDGECWRIRSGAMIQSCDGGKVSARNLQARDLTLLPTGSTPHYESVMFILTQAHEFNVVIPPTAFLSACACAFGVPSRDAAPEEMSEEMSEDMSEEMSEDISEGKSTLDATAPSPETAVNVLGWKHRIEYERCGEGLVRSWELVIPPAANTNAVVPERHVRVEVTESDSNGWPLKVIRSVEEWSGGAKVRVVGSTTLTVTERRPFDRVRDAARLNLPSLANGWTINDTTRNLNYVYNHTEFSIAGIELTAKAPIRLHPDALRLRDILSDAQAK